MCHGDVCEILGYHEANDGGKSTYKIRTKTKLDIEDNKKVIFLNNLLVAELIIEDCYIIDEITVNEGFDEQTKTHYWITHIPHTDRNGNIIKMKMGFANDTENENCIANETVRAFANRKNATLTINGGVFNNASESNYYKKNLGLIINNRKVVCDLRTEVRNEGKLSEAYLNRILMMGVTDENELITFPYNVTSETVLATNTKYTIAGFSPIMINGISAKGTYSGDNWTAPTYKTTDDRTPLKNKIYFTLNDSIYTGHVNLTQFESGVTYYEQNGGTFYKWQFLGQNTTTKDFYIFTCNGKGVDTEKGMSHEQAIAILNSFGADFAWQLDGGGSTATVFKGEMLNKKTDNNFTNEREISTFLYFSKEIIDKRDVQINNLYSKIGELKDILRNFGLDITNLKHDITNFSKSNTDDFIINASNSSDLTKITFQKDGTNEFSIIKNDFGVGLWSFLNNKTLFRSENNGDFSVLGDFKNQKGVIGEFFKYAKEYSGNLNDLLENGIKYATINAENNPFNQLCFVLTMALQASEVTTYATQIAFNLSGAATEIKIRSRTYNSGIYSWNEWKTINFDS